MSQEEQAVSKALKESFTELNFEKGEEFLQELFTDRLLIDSTFTTRGNFNLIQNIEQQHDP